MKIIFAIEKALSKITSQNKLMMINQFHLQAPKCLNSSWILLYLGRNPLVEPHMYRKIPKISSSMYKPPKPVTQKTLR